MGSAINQDARMTAHETTPSDAAIGQAFRSWLDANKGDFKWIEDQVLERAREIEKGRGAVEELPEPYFSLRWDDMNAAYYVSRPNLGSTECYTRDQLIAYGEACRRMGNRDE